MDTLEARLSARPRNIGPEEWPVRVDLAACYRLIAHFGWDDLILTHNSARVPGAADHFLTALKFSLLLLCASSYWNGSWDHTPQPNCTPDKDGARGLYRALRAAFPDFHADIHWQVADEDLVTTYKTYHGTHEGTFLGVPPTGLKIHFETVDAMRVRNGKIAEERFFYSA